MMILGGHSGMGLLVAREMSSSDDYPFITTVSKRGRPEGLGPGSALMEAISQSKTKHYMAKCDVEDPVVFNMLLEWAPHAEPRPPAALLPIDDMVVFARENMCAWSGKLLQDVAALFQRVISELVAFLKQIKYRMGNPDIKEQRQLLDQSRHLLEERETNITEVLADITTLMNRKNSSHANDPQAEEKILRAMQDAWKQSAKSLCGA
eukprot:TRINITY_DN6249_c0_g1_i1.p1 TRINITY_DN6249_c0_g1~~TRINITY_DN6249_c0_g1_i1.p1  ORF type:complete len:207 (-),score=32.21 TRINITY_DN6249_c0_g1_i1:78-698(-)